MVKFRHQDYLVTVRDRHQGGVSCTEVRWFVVICRLILQLDPYQICRPLEMHLIENWQLAERLLLVW